MRRILFIYLAAMVLTGCATNAVIEASQEHDVSFPPETFALRLVSASIVEEGGDTDRRSHLYLCLSRPRGWRDQELIFVRIPSSYPFTDDDHQGYAFKGALILSAGGASDLFNGCDAPVGARLVRKLPIIEMRAGETVTLSQASDAVVASQRDGGGLGLAYASPTPFFGGWHAVTIDLTAGPIYLVHREARPYLLLLTPVTVLVDGTEVVGLAAVTFAASFLPVACLVAARLQPLVPPYVDLRGKCPTEASDPCAGYFLYFSRRSC